MFNRRTLICAQNVINFLNILELPFVMRANALMSCSKFELQATALIPSLNVTFVYITFRANKVFLPFII